MQDFIGMQNLTYNNGKIGIGSLPYGIDPTSSSTVMSTGNLWRDDNVCFNLKDQVIVQNLPETQSVMRGLQAGGLFSQQQPYYQTGGATNFFDSLIQKQQLMNYALMQNSCRDGSDSFPMLLQLLATSQAKKEAEKEAEKAADETVKTYKSGELSGFAKNKASDSQIEYGEFSSFARKSYAKLKDKNGNVTMDSALKSIGVDPSELSEEVKKRLYATKNEKGEKVYYPNAVLTINQDQYKELLENVGFNSKKSSITRQKLQDGVDKLIGKKEDDDGEDGGTSTSSTKVNSQKIDNLVELLNSDSPTAEDSENLVAGMKDLASDKKSFKAFLDAAKDKHTANGKNGTQNILASIFTSLEAGNSDKSIGNYVTILDSLKGAAKKYKLENEWNATLAEARKEDGKMKKAIGTEWWNDRKGKLTSILDSSKI